MRSSVSRRIHIARLAVLTAFVALAAWSVAPGTAAAAPKPRAAGRL